MRVNSLDFVGLSARTEGTHGGASYVQTRKRSRIDRHSWVLERLVVGLATTLANASAEVGGDLEFSSHSQ